MKKFGVKIWSRDIVKNPAFAKENIELTRSHLFDYIELFALPGSYDDTAEPLKELIGDLPVIIHAPHSVFGLNTGNPELFAENQAKLLDSRRFADLFHAEIIILHAGNGEGEPYLTETVRQFNLLNEPRLAVENLPYQCSSTHSILHGTSPEQIKRIILETGCKFCLDFSHAVCAANAYGQDVYAQLSEYAALNPDMYHLCDGFIDSTIDQHLHYGEGNYDLWRLLTEYIADDKPVTMETGHGIPSNAEPWVKDIHYIRTLLGS